MPRHWHVETGLAGYGPEADESTVAIEGIRDVSEAIRDELRRSIDSLADTADAYAEAGDFEAAWREHKRAESLEHLAANLSNDRAQAPAYRDEPEAWNATLRGLIEESFPVDVAEHTRLYVWTCDETECTDDERGL